MSIPITVEELRGARWFAGKDRRIAGVRALAALGPLTVAAVAYDDGPDERYLLAGEALAWGPLLAALREGPLTGGDGRLELRAGPALNALLRDGDGVQAIPSIDQSNTLVTIGGRLLVKAYRKLEAGVHPEVELGAALAGAGAPVPAHAGSVHWVARDGSDTAIALLQEFVAGAASGWEEPIAAVAAHLRAGTAAGAQAVAPYAAAGRAAGALHAALTERLGTTADPEAPARWRARAATALTEAARVDPHAAAAAPEIERRLAALEAHVVPPLIRIHGDLHVAQFLRTPQRTLVIDLEGDPTVPLAARRRPDTPLRDLAALLRSIDHVGAAAARRAGPATDPTDFIDAACAAAMEAYEQTTGAHADRTLLDALELASELRELVYAHRVVPEWAYAPQAGLRRLLDRPTPEDTNSA